MTDHPERHPPDAAPQGMSERLRLLRNEIEVSLKKTDQYMVRAALKIREAKDQCKAEGVKWSAWYRQNIKLPRQRVSEMLRIAKAPDPEAAAHAIRQHKIVPQRDIPPEQRPADAANENDAGEIEQIAAWLISALDSFRKLDPDRQRMAADKSLDTVRELLDQMDDALLDPTVRYVMNRAKEQPAHSIPRDELRQLSARLGAIQKVG